MYLQSMCGPRLSKNLAIQCKKVIEHVRQYSSVSTQDCHIHHRLSLTCPLKDDSFPTSSPPHLSSIFLDYFLQSLFCSLATANFVMTFHWTSGRAVLCKINQVNINTHSLPTSDWKSSVTNKGSHPPCTAGPLYISFLTIHCQKTHVLNALKSLVSWQASH